MLSDSYPRNVRVVSEPGRYLVASAGHSAAAVVGKARREGAPWYYLDDGIYGSFGARVFDGIHYPLSVLPAASSRPGPKRLSHLAGPTCDSGDMISDGIPLPNLEPGDIVVAHVMGAYTSVTANDFNSVKRAKIVSSTLRSRAMSRARCARRRRTSECRDAGFDTRNKQENH